MTHASRLQEGEDMCKLMQPEWTKHASSTQGGAPVPGSPSSKIPFGGFPPMERYMAGSLRYCKEESGECI